jgi:sugar phosphate permease
MNSRAEIQDQFRYWRKRLLISTIAGYALFHFVRKNLSVAMPAMEQGLSIGKAQLGLFLTLHGVLYGVSRFANGFLADRVSARWLMPAGLALCGVLNLLFGVSSTVLALGLVWTFNGWFQGMGFPPCTRIMTHWFSPKELVTKMSVWNSSHSLGAGMVVVLCGYLVTHNWRWCFYVPGVLALGGAALLAMALRDTPESMGLPPVAGILDGGGSAEGRGTSRLVFRNRYIWILSLGHFFVYVVRYVILDWGPRVRDIGYFASSSTDTALTMANSVDGSKLRTILSNTLGLMPRKVLVSALTAPPASREMSKSPNNGAWFQYTLKMENEKSISQKNSPFRSIKVIEAYSNEIKKEKKKNK